MEFAYSLDLLALAAIFVLRIWTQTQPRGAFSGTGQRKVAIEVPDI
jgi:hypothetical protein